MKKAVTADRAVTPLTRINRRSEKNPEAFDLRWRTGVGSVHQERDKDELLIGETQAKLRDAIEENGRLITENQELIDSYRRRWRREGASSQRSR